MSAVMEQTYTKMDPLFKQKWVEALRSGNFLQCRAKLKSNDATPAYCCLGVLRELVAPGVTYRDEGTSCLNNDHRCGLDYEHARDLAGMNDNGKSFIEIADYIESHPEI